MENELDFFPDISKMSEEELKSFLEEIRLKRKTGFERKPRKKKEEQLNLTDDQAEVLLEELRARGLIE